MDRLFILSPTRVRCGMRNHVPFVTACQFRRNVRKERLQVVAVFLTLLAHSILPEQQDPLLFRIRCAVALAVDKGLHDLRHTAHQHVPSKRPHHALMQRSHRLFAVKVFSYERHRKCVCSRPQKLFEIKRMNLKRVLLGRNQDVFASFRHTGKRSGFQVVVASVFQKRFEGLPSLRKELNFVQDDERLSTIQLGLVLELKLCEKKTSKSRKPVTNKSLTTWSA